MGALLKIQEGFYWESCISCGITFGISEDYNKTLRRSHKYFYCPNGHSQFYPGKNTEEELRAELEAEKLKREQAERDAEWSKAQLRGAKIQQTKAQNKLKRVMTRVNAGVCPHCNRTFKQLAAHMKSKHPGLAPETELTCNHSGGGDA